MIEAINDRIKALTDKIIPGTYCSDDNHCGGCLTADEAELLEALFRAQAFCYGGEHARAVAVLHAVGWSEGPR